MEIKYNIIFSESAKTDLKQLVDYIKYELKEPIIAQSKYEKIRDAITGLTTMPKRIGLVREERLAANGFRMLVVDNYLVFFIVSEKEKSVNIVRILHSRRDWLNIL